MTLLQVLGGFLVALPFILIGSLIVREDGWRAFLIAFGLTFGIVGAITLGVFLLIGGA